MSEAGAIAAWLGGAVVVLADGKRGLAAGLVLMAAGLAAVTWLSGEVGGAVALLAGGLAAAAVSLAAGAGDWGLMRPGSTPRLILTVVIGLMALWVAAGLATGAGAALRFAVLATLGLMGARVLQASDRSIALSAGSGLALGLGAAFGIGGAGTGLAIYVIAAVVAAGVSALPFAEVDGA